MSEHLLEMAGALVRIRDGKIEVLTDPQIRRCPLRQDIYGIDSEDRKSVAQVLSRTCRSWACTARKGSWSCRREQSASALPKSWPMA